VIAPSFGGIFYNNCYRNGIVPVELSIEDIRDIRVEVEASGGQGRLEVDLETLQVTTPGGRRIGFQAPEALLQMLLQGMDEIASTLARGQQLDDFRRRARVLRPWAYC